jgi:phospholipid N-methyltransferase
VQLSGLDLTFLRAFVKAPRVVASAIPSSSSLERRTIRNLDLDNADVVVEFGAGTGGMTRAMLAAMHPDARLIAIEWTEAFIGPLGRIDDPRLEVVHGCASTICEQLERRNLPGADAVVSGIPFSTMPPELCRSIAANLYAALVPGGRFVAYQFMDSVAGYVAPLMGRPAVEHELINIPPMRVFTWRKADEQHRHNHNNVAVGA